MTHAHRSANVANNDDDDDDNNEEKRDGLSIFHLSSKMAQKYYQLALTFGKRCKVYTASSWIYWDYGC